MSRSLSKISSSLKTPNFKEIAPAPSDRKDAPNTSILMDEYGQTPDHYYLARKPPPAFFQVKRKLDLQSVSTLKVDDGTKVYKPRQRKNLQKNKNKNTVDKPRYDTSLGQLTKKFLKLLADATDGVINLNTACSLLSVPKRRLYDITNVLEGAGLVQKTSRNNIQWKGRVSSPCASLVKYELEREIDILEAKENKLDELIYYMKSEIDSVKESDSQYHYVTSEDLKNIEDLTKKLLIGVETSPSAEVVESTENTVLITSKCMEIEAYMLFNELSFENILPKAYFLENSYSVKIKNNILFDCSIEERPIDNTSSDDENEHFKVENDTIKVENDTIKVEKDIIKVENDNLNEDTEHFNEDTEHFDESNENLNESDASYSQVCGTMWTEGDTVIKNAFITEEDDIAPMGKHFLLQTEDQDLDLLPFSLLESTVENYSFSLDDGEGLTDLFDCGFSCP